MTAQLIVVHFWQYSACRATFCSSEVTRSRQGTFVCWEKSQSTCHSHTERYKQVVESHWCQFGL